MVITLDQTIFKRDLMHVFMDKFVVSQYMKKRVRVTQCKHFPKHGKEIPLGITYPIGWCRSLFFLFVNRSSLYGIFKVNGWISFLEEKGWKAFING